VRPLRRIRLRGVLHENGGLAPNVRPLVILCGLTYSHSYRI
jgi:hypothetical protein